jgi:hypothetical protein
MWLREQQLQSSEQPGSRKSISRKQRDNGRDTQDIDRIYSPKIIGSPGF